MSENDALTKDALFNHDNTVAPQTGKILPRFSLKGKTAIVAGAGAGIGLQVARGFAEAGANVAIWYNSNKSALDRAAEIEKEFGVKARAYQVNIQDEEKCKSSVTEIVKEFNGRLDVFVANSGVTWQQGGALGAEHDHYKKVVTTNIDGTFYCARAAGDHFKRQKIEGTDLHGNKLENYTYGSFIATASMSGYIVNIPQFQTAYNMSKAAVTHMVRSLAVEWVKFARANAVSPGYVNTELSDFVPKETRDIWKSKIPMGRECEPQELVGAYLYLASEASSYTTGTDIISDGGYCLP
ncbi:MAG: hypothetical protein M1831_002371 [Alyxoria varia]|nr:MAG: hypothetical protein M1831_002371 [Alyxoria varia]